MQPSEVGAGQEDFSNLSKRCSDIADCHCNLLWVSQINVVDGMCDLSYRESGKHCSTFKQFY